MQKLLAEIDSMDPSDAVFEDKVRSAVELTLHHIEEEENEVLPKFKAAVNNNEDFLRELGMQFHAASVSAPTRCDLPLLPSLLLLRRCSSTC